MLDTLLQKPWAEQQKIIIGITSFICVLRQWENVNGFYLLKHKIGLRKKVKYNKEEANNQVFLWARGGGRVALEPASPEPLFDQRGRHQVSSAKDQETQLGLWIVGALGEIACILLLGRVCISGNQLCLREGP